jgi:hypothetical protein
MSSFDMSTPGMGFFKDPRFSEQARAAAYSVGREARNGDGWSTGRVAARYADTIIDQLRAGEAPLGKVTPKMTKDGLTEQLAAAVREAVLDLARAQVAAYIEVVSHSASVLSLIDMASAKPAAPGDSALASILSD